MTVSLLYDEETGTPDVERLDEAQAHVEAEERARAVQVERMAATGGWQQLESWLREQIDACKEKLVDVPASDLALVTQLQQTVRAYSNVIGRVYEQVSLLRAAHSEPPSLTDRQAR